MQVFKVRRVGNSLGITFPKESLERFNIQEGDELFFEETSEGFFITALEPDFSAAMEAYNVTKHQYRNALHELAK